MRMPLPTPSQSSEQSEKVSDPENDFCTWFEEEVVWWSKLHGKELDAKHIATILDELLSSGYTIKQASENCVHERLRRHRWDFTIAVFYPDDKLVTSELTRAMQRAYRRGYDDARKQELMRNTEKAEQNKNDAIDIAKEVARLYNRITELESQLDQRRNK